MSETFKAKIYLGIMAILFIAVIMTQQLKIIHIAFSFIFSVFIFVDLKLGIS
jgi:hypothetical protein